MIEKKNEWKNKKLRIISILSRDNHFDKNETQMYIEDSKWQNIEFYQENDGLDSLFLQYEVPGVPHLMMVD